MKRDQLTVVVPLTSVPSVCCSASEIDFCQVDRRETGAGDHIGDVGAQVRIDDVRATDAQQRIQLLGRNVAHFEDAGLLAFDQERDLVLDLGGHGDGDGGFEDAIGQRFGADVDRHFDRRRILFQEDRRGVRLLQRQVFQVDALDLEYGLLFSLLVLFRHGMLSFQVGLMRMVKMRMDQLERLSPAAAGRDRRRGPVR